jgi:hypothetical protein
MAAPDEANPAHSTPPASADASREHFRGGIASTLRHRSRHLVSPDDDTVKGLAATGVVSVSADPQTMLAGVKRDARSHGDIITAGEVTINLATSVQQPIAERLAQPDVDKMLTLGEVASGRSAWSAHRRRCAARSLQPMSTELTRRSSRSARSSSTSR